MKKKLFITYFIIVLVTIAASEFAFWTKGYSFINEQNEENYLIQAELIADLLIEQNMGNAEAVRNRLDVLSKKYGIRITVIEASGTVVYESGETERQLDNHATREEVQGALAGKRYSVKRYSYTMKMDFCYAAVPVETAEWNGVVRIAVPLEQMQELDREFFNSTVLAILAGFLFIILLAMYFSKFITSPLDDITKAAQKIAAGDLNVKIYTQQKNQVGLLADAFNTMTDHLKDNMYKLKKRNDELEAVLYSMNSAVVALDTKNNIIFCNDNFMTLADGHKRNILGKPIFHILRNQTVYDIMDLVRSGGQSAFKEGRIFRDDERSIRVSGTPLYEKEDKKLGVLMIIEDITELKKLETMRSDFVSNVSHELKTPLTSIRGFVDTLKNGAVRDEKFARKFLDIIDIETERLYNLIQDILLLSEIENHNDYNVKENDVTKIVGDVVEFLQPKVKPAVSLNFSFEAYIKPYMCNGDRIKQLMINLIDNALKYTEEGKVDVYVGCDGQYLFLSVTDTGCGICEESLERIFERFYRVDKGRSSKTGGTGLGLSIVKHIVEMYNGFIKVESQPLEGTQFFIKLPYNR